MENLSAVIITRNEDQNIGRCIDSLWKVADEVIVLDSFSSDNTVAIALQKGAIVKQEKFAGYIEQKNRVLQLTTYDYVISLDGDEALSQTLIHSILEAKKKFKYKAYFMNRYNNYCGHFIKHGLWYPDKKIRLFNKHCAHWGGLNPHDKIVLKKNTIKKFLKGDILHYTFKTIDEHLQRNEKFTTIAAQSLFESGKKIHWGKIFISPVWSFVHSYFLRLGFLDGYYGFIIATQTAHHSFLKYQKLKRLKKQYKNSLLIIPNYKNIG